MDEIVRASLQEFINKNTKKDIIAVEVGVLKGNNSKRIYDNLKEQINTFFMIDVWSNQWKSSMTNKLKAVADYFDDKENTCIIRSSSLKAFDLFKDNSIDYLYLDNDHSYEHVNKEIPLWYPKVKKGGMISGHDYNQPGVNEAVNEFFGEKVESALNPIEFKVPNTKYWKLGIKDWWLWKK